MTSIARRRTAAIIALAASALSPLGAVHWARMRAARTLATHEASAVAGYLPLVTPAARGSADYDLPQLLIRAHALDELPGLSARFEIYHPTAPLVQATATPLPAAELEGMRREVWVHWISDRGAALAPLLDRDGWDVVGVVAAYPDVGGWPLSPWLLAALFLLVVAGGQAIRAIGLAPESRRQVLKQYWAAAALCGVAAFADLRVVTGGATDRWLSDVRLLMQEAAARSADARNVPAALAGIARGAETVPADSEPPGVGRRRVDGTIRASVAVRLAPGRWVEVRAEPGEAGTAGWLAVLLGVAALGPLTTWLGVWRAGAPRHRRETLAAWAFSTWWRSPSRPSSSRCICRFIAGARSSRRTRSSGSRTTAASSPIRWFGRPSGTRRSTPARFRFRSCSPWPWPCSWPGRECGRCARCSCHTRSRSWRSD